MPKLYDSVKQNMKLVLDLDLVEATGLLTQDKSKNHHVGTIGSGAVWTQLPSGLWTLVFDGVNDNLLTNTSTVNIAAENTFEVVASITANPVAGTVYRPILGKDDTQKGLFWHRVGSSMAFKADNDFAVRWAYIGYTPSATLLHIIGTWNGSLCRLFLNGNLVAQASTPDTWTNANYSYNMYNAPGGGRELAGQLALARVYLGTATEAMVWARWKMIKVRFNL